MSPVCQPAADAYNIMHLTICTQRNTIHLARIKKAQPVTSMISFYKKRIERVYTIY